MCDLSSAQAPALTTCAMLYLNEQPGVVINDLNSLQVTAVRMACPSNPHNSQNNYNSRLWAENDLSERLFTKGAAGRRIM